MDVNLSHYLDESGNLTSWPAKKSRQLLILEYLAGFFDNEITYREHEENEILKSHHTFQDWPLLRRELVENGFLKRDKNGYAYHRIK